MKTNLWRSAWISVWLTILAGLLPAWAQSDAEPDSPRIALVVGLQAYRAPLPTAANDAGLMAQTLAAAGFDVTAARDLGGDGLRKTFREFLDKAAAGGPRGVAVVYLAGRAVQFEGENYLVPVDARLTRDTDIPIEALRLGDFTRALAATNLGVKIVAVDGAYADADASGRYGSGLALVDADPGSLLAFNAAPGRVAPLNQGPYGLYATALAAAIKQGGVPIEEVFARLRVAVNTDSHGAVVPWSVSKLVTSFTFFDRSSDAPAVGSAQIPFASLRTRPLRDFTPEQAYDVAIARDTLPVYEEYLTVFPRDPLARRIRIALAQQREALIWRDVLRARSAPALWTYLDRYPRGPHVAEAQRRLARLGTGRGPPAGFVPIGFEIQPPPPEELEYVQPGYRLDSDLPPPPPAPLFLLPPRGPGPDLSPPRPAEGAGLLPLPAALAIPFVRPILAPGLIRPPRHLPGSYRQPRPFGASPNNDRLVPQPVDAVAPIRGPQPPDEPRRPTMPVVPLVPAQPSLPAGRRSRPDQPEVEQIPAPMQPPGVGQGAGTRQRPPGARRPAEAQRPASGEPTPPQALPGTSGGPLRPQRPGLDVVAPADDVDQRQLPRAGRRRQVPADERPEDAVRVTRPERIPVSPGLPRPERPRPLQNDGFSPPRQPPAIVVAPPMQRRPAEDQAPRQFLRPADGGAPGFNDRLGQQRPRLEQRPQPFQPEPRALTRPDAPAFGSPGLGQGQGIQPRIGIQRPAEGFGGNRPLGRQACGNPGQPPCR